MAVADHLGITLESYDERIRTFIPSYDEMLDAAADCLRGNERVIVDLGVGTGALASRCRQRARRARIVGIDSDPGILDLAVARVAGDAEWRTGSFLKTPFPRADAIVASLALHHVRTIPAKLRLFQRAASALRARRGRFISVDCYPARDRAIATRQRAEWVEHLRRSYSNRQAQAFLTQWAEEDVYRSLDTELALLGRSGIAAEVAWRRGAFAVITGTTI